MFLFPFVTIRRFFRYYVLILIALIICAILLMNGYVSFKLRSFSSESLIWNRKTDALPERVSILPFSESTISANELGSTNVFPVNASKSASTTLNISSTSKLPTTPSLFGAQFDKNDTNSSISVNILYGSSNISIQQCGPEKMLVVVMISQPQDFEGRALIRESWAREKSNKTSVIFHVGVLKNETQQKEIESQLFEEIANRSDVFVSDVVENYYNLTLKTYGALIFLAENCKNVTCAMKADSDTVLNLPAIEKLCNQSRPMTIRGACWGSTSPYRSPTSRWYVPHWVYPGNYPGFCAGGGYMIVGVGAPAKLLEAAHETRFHNSSNFRKLGEDVVWTGIVAQKAKISGAWCDGLSHNKIMKRHCFKDTRKATSLSVHFVKTPSEVLRVWREMKQEVKC